jgi:hypothetical protein
MLPEFEIQLAHKSLADRRRQVAADLKASALAEMAASGPRLLERLLCLIRFDAAHLPASEKSALRMEGHLSQ